MIKKILLAAALLSSPVYATELQQVIALLATAHKLSMLFTVARDLSVMIIRHLVKYLQNALMVMAHQIATVH
jgi:hypothetical protein